MNDNIMTLELSNGDIVELKEVWHFCDGVINCGSSVEVRDSELGYLICTIKGETLPDTDDEDFSKEDYAKHIENEISWAEIY